MSPRDRLPRHPVPPESAATLVSGCTKRLVEARAVDGADNPLRHLVDLLARWWTDVEPRPIEPKAAEPRTDHPRHGPRAGSGPGGADPPAPPGAEAEFRPAGRRHIALRGLMVLAFVGDVANLYLALSIVGNAEPLVTGLVVVALASSALGLAHLVGRFVADRAEGRSVPRWVVPAFTATVLSIGGSAAAVRLAAPLPDTGPSGGTFGAPSESLLGPAAANVVLTVLLLVLFLASVSMAAVLGYDGRAGGPRKTEPRDWGRWLRDGVDGRRVARAERRVAREAADRAWAAEEYRIRLSHHRHHGEYLRRLCEIEFAEACGDPRITTVQTHEPTRENLS